MIARQSFEKWKLFLDDISEEVISGDKDYDESSSSTEDGSKSTEITKSGHKGTYRIVTSKYIEEAKEYHYLPLPKFTTYINVNVLENNKKDYQMACLRYFSFLSRKLMRSLKTKMMNSDIDINLVCSCIDEGKVWGALLDYSDTMLMPSSIPYSKPE